MPKFQYIADTIHARVRHGDYHLRGFPSHSGLVAELGVNARTVTKAISDLVERGVLVRQETGRVDVSPEAVRAVRHIGVLSPAWVSENIMRWHHLIYQIAQARGWSVRPTVYAHWHDITISEALRGLDGVFFLSLGDDFPEHVLKQLRSAGARVVVLEQDLSSAGIPSLRYWNSAPIRQLINHLHSAGYRRVACLNTQPHSSVIHERIASWRRWSSTAGIRGPLFDEPVDLSNPAHETARALTRWLVASNGLDADAVVCTTNYIGMGVVRGLLDEGVTPGRDVGVCSVEDWSRLSGIISPSLTCLRPTSMDPLLQACFDYFAQPEAEWLGPLLMQPASMDLVIGESTTGMKLPPAHSG